jgi:hypothetical protein
MLVMENDLLRLSVLLDKGSEVIEFLHKPTDTDFMWRSPLVHLDPYKYLQSVPNTIDFRDYYMGGWQEIFPVGGAGFELAGARIGNHGELWGLPWGCQVVQDEAEEVQVKLWAYTLRTPFYVEKSLSLRRGTPVLSISERIENLGEIDLGIMWGHHPAFGESFLDEHCVLRAPAGSMLDEQGRPCAWPVHEGGDFRRILPKHSDKWNMYFLQDLSEGWYALVNQKKRLGFGMAWDKSLFRYLWFWGCYNFRNLSPWYGRAYTVAVEPFTSLPHAMAPDTLLTIPARGTIRTELKAVVIEGKGNVEKINPDGTVVGT